MAHTCHALGCEVPVAPKLFMCAPHWRTLPRLTQARIWQHYRPGQEQDKRPSPEYVRVAREAIHWLHEHEGKSGLFCVVCIEAEKENPAMDEEAGKRDSGKKRSAKKAGPEYHQFWRGCLVKAACRQRRITSDIVRAEATEAEKETHSTGGREDAFASVMTWGVGKELLTQTKEVDTTSREGGHRGLRRVYLSKIVGMTPVGFDLSDLKKQNPKDY